jgi:hypothetical protein
MSRPRSFPPLEERIGVLLSHEHRAWIDAQTRDHGLPLSAVIRKLIERAACSGELNQCGCGDADEG